MADKPKKLLLLLIFSISLSDCGTTKLAGLFFPSSRPNFRKEKLQARDSDRPTAYGPSRTVVGEDILVIFAPLRANLGGKSNRGAAFFSNDGATRGFPGSFSQWNGTETDEWNGGVCGVCSGLICLQQYGILERVSLGVEFGSSSSSAESIVER